MLQKKNSMNQKLFDASKCYKLKNIYEYFQYGADVSEILRFLPSYTIRVFSAKLINKILENP